MKKYFIKEIHQNEFMNKKHKKVYTILKYTEFFFILVSAINGCFSIYSHGIKSSAIRLKIFAVTAEIKKYNSVIKKKKIA